MHGDAGAGKMVRMVNTEWRHEQARNCAVVLRVLLVFGASLPCLYMAMEARVEPSGSLLSQFLAELALSYTHLSDLSCFLFLR